MNVHYRNYPRQWRLRVIYLKTKATGKAQDATNQLLDYLATHPDATILYHASDMILQIHSDDSYLSVSNARSRLGGLFSWATTPRAR
jgi:hypothetical protein